MPEGNLYVVDVTAPPGAPKVLRIDVDSREVGRVYTDDTSAFTSAQFSPRDGRLYLTGLPVPNGIAFTPGFDGVWVSQNSANRIDYLRLDGNGQKVLTAHPGIHPDGGIPS